jgi:putative ABC transport system substrate-binding protein
LLLFCLAMPPAASAQVTLLVERGASTYQQAAQGFQQAFANTGRLEQIYVDENSRALEASLDRLRRNPPRLVVAIGTQAARIARARLPNIPILYCLALRPVQNQLVGGNIGGIALDVALSQQFENIRKALPNLRRIGVVYDELTSGTLVRQAQQYLGSSVQLVVRDARTPQQAAREIQDLLSNVLGPADAFWLLWDSVAANPANFRLLVELGLRYKVPLIAPARPFVEAGALISVAANYEQAGRQAAVMAQQVLSGRARPETFSAVPPAEIAVTINGEVARRLGITFPPDLRADVLAPTVGARTP